MNSLTTLKEEARKEFDEKFLVRPQSEFSVAAHQLHLKDFLDSLIDRTYHATKEEWLLKLNDEYAEGMSAGMKIGRKDSKEEVRNLVPKKRENFPSSESSYDRGFRRGYDMARGDLRSAIDALEDTTTSPNH